MLFGRKRSTGSSDSVPPTAPSTTLTSGLASPAPGPTRFEVQASFHLTGLGEVIGGTVSSGTLRVGGKYRHFHPNIAEAAPFAVEVHRIVWRERPDPAVILYRGQNLRRLDFAGPGQQVSVGVRGVPKGAILKGDHLED